MDAPHRTRRRPSVTRWLPRWLPLAAAGLSTAALYVVVVLVTGFLACGVSGCGGGGFGPAYAPTQAQAGLVVAGLALVPLTVWSLRRRGWLLRAGAGVAVVALGAACAMVLLGLGPDGCPSSEERAVTGPEAYDAGSATCSGDRDAVPRR